MKRKKTISALKNDLDKVFSKFIRTRDSQDGQFVCISSGRTLPIAQMNCGHFYSRVHLATRWDERNCNGQSIGDNLYKHGNIHGYRKGMLAKYGEGVLQELEELHNQPIKLERAWLEQKIQIYKDKLNNSI